MKYLFLLVCSFCFYVNVSAQDELQWRDEIEKLKKTDVEEVENAEGLILLTGSSSARLWKEVKTVFPDYTVINNGFGGSQMHELLYFLDELVINYQPDKILIYEGDNDINAGKTAEEIMTTTRKLVARIENELPNAEIYFISPKPSLARWNLADKYIDLNKKLEKFCEDHEGLSFIDVWYPMLDETGKPIKDIFIEDGLHMNAKGYKIWESVVKKVVLEE